MRSFFFILIVVLFLYTLQDNSLEKRRLYNKVGEAGQELVSYVGKKSEQAKDYLQKQNENK